MSKPMENGYNGAAGASSIMSDEKIGSIFGSDPLLTTQFLQNVRRKTVLEPETRLMVAILEDAIDCFQTNLLARGVTNVRLFNEAATWILAADSDWIFSFDNICEHLGLDPAYVRQGLIGWMEKELGNQRAERGSERKKLAG